MLHHHVCCILLDGQIPGQTDGVTRRVDVLKATTSNHFKSEYVVKYETTIEINKLEENALFEVSLYSCC